MAMEKDIEFFMNQNYRVSLYHDPDGYWVAEHPELPGCIADGETAQEALSSLEVSRELWIESRLAIGLEVPVPLDEPQHSGKFVLRIAKRMHRELAKEAEAEGVSLNTHISNILAGRNARREQPITATQDFQEIVWAAVRAQGRPSMSTPMDAWYAINAIHNLPACARVAGIPYQDTSFAPQRLPAIERTNPLTFESYQERKDNVA